MAEGTSDQAVNLGCGTLILIALIVLFFSNRGSDEIERELRSLQAEVRKLRTEVQAQTAILKGKGTQTGNGAPPAGDNP